MNIIKRSGAEVPFDKEKIVSAISKANKSVPDAERIPESRIGWITERIEAEAAGASRAFSVEEIQDRVEEALMSDGFFSLARNYITYRYERAKIRDDKALMEKLTASNVQNQNANMDEASFSGRMGETMSLVAKKYALEHVVSKKSARNHVNNEIYIHDLDSYAVGMHNCLSCPIDKLLANGFKTRQCDVRPAGSINTAMQLVAVIFQLQSLQQFGGVAATHLDWTMVPYVRRSFKKHYAEGMKYIEGLDDGVISDFMRRVKSGTFDCSDITKDKDTSISDDLWSTYPKVSRFALDMTIRELEQAVEGMYHNLCTLQSRSGGQLPFSSINYGTCTLPEGRMVTKALLEGSIKGVGKFHKTPIFPCGIFQSMKGVNRKPGDPNYDLFRLALKSTSLRLYPNYCNCNWTKDSGYDINNPCTYPSEMGCRTYSAWDVNADSEALKHLKDGRGNVSPVSIILPVLAMQASRRAKRRGTDAMDEFMEILDKKIDEARDMLLERYRHQCAQPAKSARFMYENGTFYGYKPDEGVASALKHGTFAIGQLGLAETLQILIGCDHTEERGMEAAKRIEQLFNTKCATFKKEMNLNFGVYYTPAENLCYTAMLKFKEKYGVIPKVSDHDFWTNSVHVPVWHKLTPFEKIDIEAQLTGYSNAGCITYVELDSSSQSNIDALEELVNYAMEKDILYFAINTPNDTCEGCGFTGDIGEKCPQCGGTDIKRLRRVTGYLTGDFKTAFNLGKQQETEMRVKHNGIEA